MVIWVAHITGFDHHTLTQMTQSELQHWHEQVIAFHKERLQEKVDLVKEALGTGQTAETTPKRPNTPLGDFF